FQGLGILNVANPYQPQILTHWDNCPGWPNSIAITDNNHAVLACLNGVWIINNSNLQLPYARSFLKYLNWYAYGLAINDTFVYVSMFDSLRIINIANPDTPRVIGRLRTSWSRTLFYRDNVLYHCPNSTPAGFYTIDVSNPSSPTVLGYIPFPSDAYGMFIKGNYAYIGDGGYTPPPYGEDGGFRIINVANPSNPYHVYQYIPNTEGYMKGVYVVGDTAYVCDDENGIFIFDVSNPSNPILLTIYPTRSASDIIVRGNLAFLADGYFGIRILDISNLQSIQEVGYYQRGWYAKDIKVIDNLIHVILDEGGYAIFEYYGAGLEEGPSQNNVARKLYLEVLPLPSKSAFLIKYNIINQNKVSLDILDPMGRIKRVIKNETMKVGDYQLNLDVSDLPAGVYFIRLKQERDQIVKKITIVR
ncbi:MAG: T9SS type A sorting domain-containing protein, partial [candidate division WOR-3 bacterium]